MLLTFRLLMMFALLFFSTGCLEALQNHNRQVRAGKRHEGIEAECKARDAAALKERLKTESDSANFKLANDCYNDIKIDALLATDCDAFARAFTWTEEREGNRTKSSRSELVDFSLDKMDEPEKNERLVSIAKKALECKNPNILFGHDGHTIRGTPEGAWTAAYSKLEDDGGEVYPLLLEYLRETDNASDSRPDSHVVVSWINKTRKASDCAELDAATKKDSLTGVRADLLYFFAKSGCKNEVRTLAGEMLVSDVPRWRMDACSALREAKDKTHIAKMRRLAKTDTARTIEKAQAGFWTYGYVTFPVREACQEAINKLELADER